MRDFYHKFIDTETPGLEKKIRQTLSMHKVLALYAQVRNIDDTQRYLAAIIEKVQGYDPSLNMPGHQISDAAYRAKTSNYLLALYHAVLERFMKSPAGDFDIDQFLEKREPTMDVESLIDQEDKERSETRVLMSGKGLEASEDQWVRQVIQMARDKNIPEAASSDLLSRLDPQGELAEEGVKIFTVKGFQANLKRSAIKLKISFSDKMVSWIDKEKGNEVYLDERQARRLSHLSPSDRSLWTRHILTHIQNPFWPEEKVQGSHPF
jgi:hypothetical protein